MTTEATQALAVYEEEAAALEPLELTVTDAESYQAAADILVSVKTSLKAIEAERKKIAGPLYESFKATNALFSRLAERFERAEVSIKKSLAAYTEECLAKERAALQAAATAETHSLTLVAEAAPVAQGVSSRQTKAWRLVDASLVPDEFWIIDEKAIAKAVRASVNVPGIEIYYKTTIAAGSN